MVNGKRTIAEMNALKLAMASFSAENTAQAAKRTVSTFQHVVRASIDDVNTDAPICRYNRILNKATRFADPLDNVYESKYEWQNIPSDYRLWK